MRDVRNNKGKLVCRIDEANRIVEIVHKRLRTEIVFAQEKPVAINNSSMKRELGPSS